ncbi:DJ-1/PfpI family protein [Thermocatellispora tengchongensis]|uniref:DJ-1/PfpI family protein n=1 Tax=Thermocatellispora tengchongensis TaxID=1073253 RepID=UPI003625F16F
MPAAGEADTAGRGSWWRFAWHFLEMVVAMLAGMLVLGAALSAVLGAVGWDYSHAEHPVLGSLEMVLAMSLGMAAWMRYRRHSRVSILEMVAAMFAPLVVLVPLLWAGAVSGATTMALLHVLMLPAMLIVMLRRREEYTRAHGPVRPAARALGRGLAVLLVFLLVPGAVYAAGSAAYARNQYSPPEITTATATPPVHDPGKPTAVVVVGNSGANIADALVSYEVLAVTGAFNVYTVAPERRPLPLLGGLDLVPDLSFAQLEQRLSGSDPDVTVVPAMPDSDASDRAMVTSWIRDTASEGLLLSVCAGAQLAAEAGLLDGRDATSHWYRISGFEHDHPEVNWRRGIRYIDDGDVISTGGLLSAVDGTLRVVERLVGADAARAAAQAVGWRYYTPGRAATLPQSELTLGDAVLYTLNIGFRWDAPTVGVVLTDGVGELELAAAFDPYAEHSMAARTVAVTPDGAAVRSRHGLTFVPRDTLANASDRFDRLLVPGAAASPHPAIDAARRDGVPVEFLRSRPGFAFDAALRDVARTMDVPTARWAAKVLEYPADGLGLSGPGWPWTLALRPLLLGLAGLAVALGATWLIRRARTRRPVENAAPST